MKTLEALKGTIRSVEDLQSVVKTMKALAAVSIRQYEQAVESLVDYNRTVEMGLQIVMRQRYFAGNFAFPSSMAVATKLKSDRHLGVIIFGSDQGLCGQFNEQIVAYATSQLDELQGSVENEAIAVVGARPIPLLEGRGYPIAQQFSVPHAAVGITQQVQEILLTIQQWQAQQDITWIILFYNQPQAGTSYRSRSLQLLPMDADWLHRLEHQPWPTQVLPTFTMDESQLLSALVRQYLFISLYRAFAASLASENASRLSSMQMAEKNIEERLSDLNAEYRRQRQSSITEELLDIVAGFEALTQPFRR
ncbi:MAG: F0F1 ATP synthase subunit gamma [Leptolyngbyaceae bacterium]|nr:F0F1 ATP synthase subunit gamma [Leptolyngbyaceae bacterium]